MNKILPFTKMHGCGNDYIYINCFENEVDTPELLSILLSNRHTGIGGDGLVLILPSDIADAKMRMFNYDGSEAKMCGNAIRCVAKYLYDNGMVVKPGIAIDTLSGVRELQISTSDDGSVDQVRVDMGMAVLRPELIPVAIDGESVIARPVVINGTEYVITCVSMGNPHAVIFCDDVDRLDLCSVGPVIENAPIFPDRVNAELIEVLEKNRLKMRVWERGSGETRACGTGACAAAVAAVLNGFCDMDANISVHLPGGVLVVNYTREAVFMTGPSVRVFTGFIELD